MTNRGNQNNNQQSGQPGKVVGIAAAISAGSGMAGFGAGYGGAAIYDKMQDEPEIEMLVEEDVEVTYDEDHQETIVEPAQPQTIIELRPENTVVDINSVPIIINGDPLPDINPDQVTDEILAEEIIDPNDIDDATLVSFTSLGTQYDPYGNEVTVAYFHDNSTNSDMMLVDKDGDGTFDYVADTNGNYYSDTVMGNVFTVDDVEAQISDSTYLAATGTPDTVLDNGDSFLNDIITV